MVVDFNVVGKIGFIALPLSSRVRRYSVKTDTLASCVIGKQGTATVTYRKNSERLKIINTVN